MLQLSFTTWFVYETRLGETEIIKWNEWVEWVRLDWLEQRSVGVTVCSSQVWHVASLGSTAWSQHGEPTQSCGNSCLLNVSPPSVQFPKPKLTQSSLFAGSSSPKRRVKQNLCSPEHRIRFYFTAVKGFFTRLHTTNNNFKVVAKNFILPYSASGSISRPLKST